MWCSTPDVVFSFAETTTSRILDIVNKSKIYTISEQLSYQPISSVGALGIGPRTSVLSGQRSTTELCARTEKIRNFKKSITPDIKRPHREKLFSHQV